MVKKTVLLFTIFYLPTSCWCNYKPLYNHKTLKRIRANNSFDNTIYSKIDTTIVYEYVYSIQYYRENKKLFPNKIIEHKDYFIPDNGRIFLKFYSNGLTREFKGVGYNNKAFKLIENYKLSRKDFNPKNRTDGILFTKKGKLWYKQYTVLDCSARLIRYEMSVKGDTIIVEGNDPGWYIHEKKYVYVKRNIPKEYLEGWYLNW